MKARPVALVLLGLIVLSAVAILLATAEAQQMGKVHRVGVLFPGSPPLGPLEVFRQALRELGHVEGQNLVLDWRFAEGDNERLPGLAGELVHSKVDLILAVNTQAAQAAKKATTETPIVIARVADPVRTGVVASIARPGGNITGVSAIPDELGQKRLEMLKEIVPRLSRVALLWNSGNPGAAVVAKMMEDASQRMGLHFHSLGIRSLDDIPGALQAALGKGVQALLTVDDVQITTRKTQILDTASAHRVPVVSAWRGFAESGALMSYGQSESEMYRRAAAYVDKILKGAKPADLPVEQPTKFELVINLKTAKALGLTIPQSLLLRADQLIE